MFKLLNYSIRTRKLLLSCELQVLKQQPFASEVTAINDKDESSNRASATYCLNLVRQYDYENYLCTLLMTDKSRQSAFGIRAFNVEVSKIASVVSDDKIGTMRLKFWYDAIEKIFSNQPKPEPIPEHPVIKEIHLAIRDHNLNKMYFSRLIKCRERPSNRGFLTTKELEQYAEKSVSSIYFLLVKILKCESMDVDHALPHLGKAHGIVNMLRAQSRLDRSKGVCIPQETMFKHGISQERILRNKMEDKGVQDCIFEVASVATFGEAHRVQSIEDLKRQVAQLRESERRLLEDNEILSAELEEHRDLSLCKDLEHNKEKKKLQVKLENMETRITECAQTDKKEKNVVRENKALTERISELQKELYNRQKMWDKEHAEIIQKYEKKIKQVIADLDEKLYRMKERMKNLYTESTTKERERHYQLVLQLKNENQELVERLDGNGNTLPREMYKITQENLQLRRENELLKNKLRLQELNKRGSRLSAPSFASPIEEEDEVEVVLNHLHLTDPGPSTPSASSTMRRHPRHPSRVNETPPRILFPHYLRLSTYAVNVSRFLYL